jgi:hypothetical protein
MKGLLTDRTEYCDEMIGEFNLDGHLEEMIFKLELGTLVDLAR